MQEDWELILTVDAGIKAIATDERSSIGKFPSLDDGTAFFNLSDTYERNMIQTMVTTLSQEGINIFSINVVVGNDTNEVTGITASAVPLKNLKHQKEEAEDQIVTVTALIWPKKNASFIFEKEEYFYAYIHIHRRRHRRPYIIVSLDWIFRFLPIVSFSFVRC